MIGIGIIGYGKMGRIRAQAVRESGQGEIVAVFDADLNAVIEPSLRAASPDAILADSRVQAVFICTPNYLNQPLTIASLRAGKHVFCEKPPAFTSAEVEEIIAAEAACNGCKLMFGFNHRHHESIKKAKSLIDSG